MKWFLIVVAIHNSNHPKFFAHEMADAESCFKSVAGATVQVPKSGDYGNAIAMFCANKPADIAYWQYNGQLWTSEPREN